MAQKSGASLTREAAMRRSQSGWRREQ